MLKSKPKHGAQRMLRVTWPGGRGQKQPRIGNTWPQFAYSLWHFHGAPMNNKGRLLLRLLIQESRAVARKPRDAAAVLFGLKFADNIHYMFKCSQASKAMLQSSKNTGTQQNLTQNGDSRSFKVTCFVVSGKAIRKEQLNCCRPRSGRTTACHFTQTSRIILQRVCH